MSQSLRTVAGWVADGAANCAANVPITLSEMHQSLEAPLALVDLCHVWYSLRQAKEHYEAVLKEVNKLYGRVGGMIPAKMEEDEIDKVSVPELERTFYPKVRYSASMVDKGAAMEWLRKHDAGSLIQETVNANTLASYLKDHMLETGEEPPDALFNFSSFVQTGSSKYRPKPGAIA